MFVLNLDGISFSKAGTTPTAPPEIIRVFGENRYDTSIEIGTFLIEQIRYQLENDNLVYPAAIIATGDNFPDALAGSALSTAKVAPILLISNKVPASVDAAL
ncbi:MAG: cell wall-binding repeat-containing protein, partial [Firmicutes bacterium]|nr:cell wall-binding repeat-containing protein [Bacillota bacterium]